MLKNQLCVRMPQAPSPQGAGAAPPAGAHRPPQHSSPRPGWGQNHLGSSEATAPINTGTQSLLEAGPQMGHDAGTPSRSPAPGTRCLLDLPQRWWQWGLRARLPRHSGRSPALCEPGTARAAVGGLGGTGKDWGGPGCAVPLSPAAPWSRVVLNSSLVPKAAAEASEQCVRLEKLERESKRRVGAAREAGGGSQASCVPGKGGRQLQAGRRGRGRGT